MARPETKLLSLDDAARATGLTVKALRRRIERGTLTSVSVRGRRRIELSELLRRGLLVGLDADLTARPVPDARSGGAASSGTVLDRLSSIERRLAAVEEQLAVLADRRGGDPGAPDTRPRRRVTPAAARC